MTPPLAENRKVGKFCVVNSITYEVTIGFESQEQAQAWLNLFRGKSKSRLGFVAEAKAWNGLWPKAPKEKR